jgi:tetratricopeptide (TPR) repeat protein
MANNPADISLLGKIAGYIEILGKDPRSTVFVSLAETYRQMGLLDDALEVAGKGVQALPMFSPGYAILGRIQTQRGALDAAAAAFDKALLIERENLGALKGLARVRAQQGERTRALELVQRVLALKPDDAFAGQLLAALQKGAPAAAAPTPVPVAELRPAEAVAAAASPTVSEPGAEVVAPAPAEEQPISTATIAEIYIRQGFLQRALKVYRDLLEADPHNEEIRQKLVALKRQLEAPPAPEAPEAADAGAATLEVLNRWLDSIRHRRADVR